MKELKIVLPFLLPIKESRVVVMNKSCIGCKWAGSEAICRECKTAERIGNVLAERRINERIKNSAAVSAPHVEPDISHEPLGAKEAQGLDTRCCINVHSIRKRLADADGISAKAVIDGLRHAGILRDDSPKYLRSVSYSQEQTKGPEETIITITWED